MLKHKNSEEKKPSRVILLGGGGFIGKKLGQQLEERNIQYISITRSDIDLLNPLSIDLLSEKITTEDSLVFLSAITPDKGKGIDVFLKNIKMCTNVCIALEKVMPKHVIYFSSDAVYSTDETNIFDTVNPNPKDLYGMMHFAREVMLKNTVKTDLAILRPTLIYGAEDTHNSYGPNRFRRMAQKEKNITLFGKGVELRDHVFVDDIVSLTVLTLLYGSVGHSVLATGQSTSFYDVAKKVSEQFNDDIGITQLPQSMPVQHRHFDVTSIFKSFPKFRFTSLDDGIKKTHNKMLVLDSV